MAELKLRKNEKGMILAIDMGNTNIVIGCVDETRKYYLRKGYQQIIQRQKIGIRHRFEDGA